MAHSPALTEHEIALLTRVFHTYPEVQHVKLFGSRAKGTHSASSDIDFALYGKISALRAETIAAELDELPLPYRFDVKTFEMITLQTLREHIERAGLLVYSASSLTNISSVL